MDNKITNRQKELLKYIVEEYVLTANPVGSKIVIEKYMKNISAATVRNEMATLEKLGYLEKNHTSSGRVPSTLGYKFYEKEFSHPYIDDENLKMQLRNIFSDRTMSIDVVIEESCKIISESTKLPLIKIEKNEDILLKRIDLVIINKQSAMIIVITSDGNLNKNILQVKNESLLKDISICIRIFNDRLIDCPIKEIESKINSMKSIIKEKVKEYEFVLQELVERIFHIKTKMIKTVHGQSSLLTVPEFQDKEKLKEILQILESTTIWEQIAFKQNETGSNTLITFGDEVRHEDIVFAQTDLEITKQNKTKLVMVAPTRVDYSKIKGLLEFIKNEFEKGWK
ncbi:MAG: heat-inducible transcriptional repressor HrcA [Malacoplasma sp.]|nr:heat-inducible transcriptional repressor HrcA [Malacoplasma sp.]